MGDYPRALGAVLTPADAGYDNARHIWNERFDCRPQAIAYPRDTGEVGCWLEPSATGHGLITRAIRV